ncbi:MAG: hypothetical protein KGO49_07475 [Gammaproteobacteria bacterium]|nr:hypothetical protein [Gammaproteobacteria bacterium]
MKISRRIFLGQTLYLSTLALSGCIVTPMLFKDHQSIEKIVSVLISTDTNKAHLVVVTTDWHYIFDTPSRVVEALKAPHHSVAIELKYLHIRNSGVVLLNYSLMMPPFTGEDNNKQVPDGYIVDKESGNFIWNGFMEGKRYAPSNILIPSELAFVNKLDEIHVSSEQSNTEKAVKLPLTPITIAADGVVLIGMLPLALLWAIVATNGRP